jgi:hypothetical protein
MYIIYIYIYIFFFFWQHWGLNSEPHASGQVLLLLEPLHQLCQITTDIYTNICMSVKFFNSLHITELSPFSSFPPHWSSQQSCFILKSHYYYYYYWEIIFLKLIWGKKSSSDLMINCWRVQCPRTYNIMPFLLPNSIHPLHKSLLNRCYMSKCINTEHFPNECNKSP